MIIRFIGTCAGRPCLPRSPSSFRAEVVWNAWRSIRIVLDEPDALWGGERVMVDGRRAHRAEAVEDSPHDNPGAPPLLLATLTLVWDGSTSHHRGSADASSPGTGSEEQFVQREQARRAEEDRDCSIAHG